MLVPATPLWAISDSAVSKMCWRWPPGADELSGAIPPLSGLPPPQSNHTGQGDNLPGRPCVCDGVVDAALVFEGSVTVGPSGRAAQRDDLLEAVFSEHYGGFCRLAGLLLGDSAAAEEVVQEAFLRTFSSWWRLRQPDRARWYVRAAVVNLCRSRLRRRGSEEAGNRASWRDPTEWSDDSVDDALVVLDAVRTLPPRQRETVILRYYQDLSERDVAALLGCSVGTVKSQLARARATLARSLPRDATAMDEEDTDAPD
jgi:RNA polymerase sigma-70 factor (sigma-E family)